MRKFSLTEVVRAGRVAENVSEDGAVLRYRPDQQVLGKAAIVEVAWPNEARDGLLGLVEVVPDASGELLVSDAEVPNSFSIGGRFRLPLIPDTGWTHEKGCDCGACQD